MNIPGFEGLNPLKVGKKAIKEYLDDDMNTYAGALTYRILLAIFPFLIFLLTVLSAFGLTNFFDWAVEEARDAFPGEVASQLETIIDQVREGATGGLLSFGLIGALWAAAGGIRSAINALNAAYDVEDSRPNWKLFPMSLLFTIGLALVLVASGALLLLGPQAMEWLADQVGLGTAFVTTWTWLRIPTALLLMVVAVALMYYFFPNVDQPFRLVSPGSVVAVISWVLATFGFSIYLSNFSNFNATYGSLGGVVVLMLYFFVSSITLLAGAEVNAVIYKVTHNADGTNIANREDYDDL
jgi:membrane protein